MPTLQLLSHWPLTEIWFWSIVSLAVATLATSFVWHQLRKHAIEVAFESGSAQADQDRFIEREQTSSEIEALRDRYRALELDNTKQVEALRSSQSQRDDLRGELELKRQELAEIHQFLSDLIDSLDPFSKAANHLLEWLQSKEKRES